MVTSEMPPLHFSWAGLFHDAFRALFASTHSVKLTSIQPASELTTC